jgi:hypothetical protein
MKNTEENKFSRKMSHRSPSNYYMTVVYGNLKGCENQTFVVPWQLQETEERKVYESRIMKV